MSVYRGSGHRLDVLVDHAGHLKRAGENRPVQRTGLGAGLVGVVVFVGLYALIAAQQFTRYAQPAGMDLTIAGVAAAEAVAGLIGARWPLTVTVNATLSGLHGVAGGVCGSPADVARACVF